MSIEVRPLEWEAVGDGFVREQAECVVGLYRLAQSRISGKWVWSLNALDTPWSLALATLNEAKAAAQADYEHRIRSALIPASPTEPVEGEGWQAAPEDIAVMPETDVPQPVKFRTASEIEAARLARKAVPSSPPASGEPV